MRALQEVFFVVFSILTVTFIFAACTGTGSSGGGNGSGGNTTPVADAGADRNISTGLEAALDGSGSSDADNDLLTYNWSVLNVPGGSIVNTGSLSNSASAVPTFTPDLDGEYEIGLVVNDGIVNSASDMVTLTAHTPGDLDASFGIGGIVNTDIHGPAGPDQAEAVAIDAFGNIVAAGESHDGTDFDFAVVRYLPDGTPDGNFGTNGIVTTDISGLGDQDYARGVAIQSDGKIVAAGYIYNGDDHDFALVRYNTDGSPDDSFGTNGIVTTDISGADSDDFAYALAIDALGNIVAAGQSYGGSTYDFALVRYTADGTPDSDFGTNGIVVTDISSSTDRAYAVTIQPDGKIVAAGYYNDDFAVVRYLADGTPDDSFSGDGIVTTNASGGGSSDSALAVALQADGKVVTAGYGSSDFALVRYTTSGVPDDTFDGDGVVTTNVTGGDSAHAVAVQSDGKILAAGDTNNSGTFQIALVRYLEDGSLDDTLDGDGIVTTALQNEAVGAIAVQPDGRIIVAGSYINGSGNYDFFLVRYWP